MEKVWQIAERKFDDLIDQLLYNRGIVDGVDSEGTKEDFFHPDFDKDLYNPFLLKNCEKAVSRIKRSVEKGEKIGIFADYDADGIPAAALLHRAFVKLGAKPIVYIPSREEGYGLSEAGLDYLKLNGCQLVVTVDLGIRSIKEASYAKKIGIDLIITDHHLPGDEIPDALYVINPKQKGDKYPFNDLCGCGVAFKLVQGLSKSFPKLLDDKFLKWNLDLVAISTISDVVSLNGENRVFAKFGLIVLQKTKNLGLSELIKQSGIKPETIGAYSVGFQIGPRINAPGRIAQATKSFELLVTDDSKEAIELALFLNEKNEERQLAMNKAEKEAVEYIEKNKLSDQKIIVVAGDWARGIIGPTASRIVEKYSRPVILFTKDDEILTGSARSISGVNIVEILTKASDTIEKFGGHAGAAGVAVAKGKFKKFIKSIAGIAASDIKQSDLVKKIKIDVLVEPKELSKNLYEKLLRFEPFGMGNPRPVFAAENVTFKYPRFVGKENQHFSSQVCKGDTRIKSICFNLSNKELLKDGANYDIAFSLGLDEWNGESKLNLNIIDIKPNAEKR